MKEPFACPILLQGRKKIAATFCVNPATVTQWAREGAPIWREGNMWQVDYHSLVRWFEVNRRVFGMGVDCIRNEHATDT